MACSKSAPSISNLVISSWVYNRLLPYNLIFLQCNIIEIFSISPNIWSKIFLQLACYFFICSDYFSSIRTNDICTKFQPHHQVPGTLLSSPIISVSIDNIFGSGTRLLNPQYSTIFTDRSGVLIIGLLIMYCFFKRNYEVVPYSLNPIKVDKKLCDPQGATRLQKYNHVQASPIYLGYTPFFHIYP